MRNSVRRLREKAGLTQAALAWKAGVTERTVGRCERGEDRVGLPAYRKLAEALGLPVDELLAEDRTTISA